MREMIIDQCLGTGREYTREELQAAVNKALESRDMLPVKSKVTILQDINEMNEKFHRIYEEYGIVSERRGSGGCLSWNGLTRCRPVSTSRS